MKGNRNTKSVAEEERHELRTWLIGLQQQDKAAREKFEKQRRCDEALIKFTISLVIIEFLLLIGMTMKRLLQ